MRDKNSSGRHRRKTANIDGFVSSGNQLGAPVHRSYSPSRGHQTPTLDGLNSRTDGFHPARATAAGVGGTAAEAVEMAAVLDEPIVLDDMDYEKRKDKMRGRVKRARLRKVLKRSALVLGIILLAGVIYLVGKFYITQRHLFRGGGNAPVLASSCDGNVPVTQLAKEGDSRVNVLLLGRGGDGHEAPDLTDTIMVASLDTTTHRIDLLSVPRDLWVSIPGDGNRKINEAYYFGKTTSTSKDPIQQERAGIKLADRVVSQVLGINIHYNMLVDFKAFSDVVNALGGVDATVTPETSAYENFWIEGTFNPPRYYLLNVQAGNVHFDGTKALYFARERHNDSDFVRGERQRLLLAAIKEKALSAGTFTNPVRVSSLLDSLGNNIYTDFDSPTVRCLYSQVSQVPSKNIHSLDLVTPPHNLLASAFIPGVSALQPAAGLFNYSAIHDYVHGALKDGFIAKENASVAVYNATTTPGVATATANLLKTYGYRVTTVANAPNPTNQGNTVVVDLTKGVDKYTRHYLETRYGVTAVSNVPQGLGISPPQGTSFVIIVGSNAAVSG